MAPGACRMHMARNMAMALMLLVGPVLGSSRAVFPSCPWECPGTALSRQQKAMQEVAKIDLNDQWTSVRAGWLVTSCTDYVPSKKNCDSNVIMFKVLYVHVDYVYSIQLVIGSIERQLQNTLASHW